MSKIMICIPAMDQVATGFAQSLAMLQKAGHEVCVAIECGSLVYDSRNKLAQRALKADGCEWTLWFDSDMIFEPDTMTKLLAHNEPIVSGLYFRRNPPYTPVAFDKCDTKNREWSDLPLPDKTTECGGIGFGCVLVKTDVLFDVAAKFGTWFEPMNGFGEDLSFCWRARECGYKILLDPSVKCGHVGHIVVTDSFYKAFGGLRP